MERCHAGARPSERATSPVIGTVLMLGVVVLLAAVVASMTFGFEGMLREPIPANGFDHDYAASGAGNTNDRPYVNISNSAGRTVDGGDITITDESGNSVTWEETWTGGQTVEAGEFVHIDGFGSDEALDPICGAGQTYRIIYTRDDGTTAVVDEWTVPVPPDLPADSTHNSGDGTPTWC